MIIVGPAGLLHTDGRLPHHSGSAVVRETEHSFSRGATPPKRGLATVVAMAAPTRPETTTAPAKPIAPPSAVRGRWIDDWRPEDPHFWESTGGEGRPAQPVFSIFSEHIGFSVWSLWSVLVLFLGPSYGFSVDPAGKFLLTTVPTARRLPSLRLPVHLRRRQVRRPQLDDRQRAACCSSRPSLAAIVLRPGVSYAHAAGRLAASPASAAATSPRSMANINAFYPDRLKGWALGLNAGGGNLGVAVVQLVGLLVLATAGARPPAADAWRSTSR